MADDDHSLAAQVELALANAKRTQREARIVIRDLARIRDAVQSQEDTTNEQ